MVASTAGVKARTPKPLNNDGLSNFEQPMAEGTDAVRDFAKQGAAYSKDVYERAKAMADETNKVLEQSYSTVTKATADFNLQWIEILHANTNSAFDFCRKLLDGRERGHEPVLRSFLCQQSASQNNSIRPAICRQNVMPNVQHARSTAQLRNSGTEICMLGLRRWSTRYAG